MDSKRQHLCNISGHPLPIVSWWKDFTCLDNSPDYNITYNNGECVLKFEELSKEDAADYTCKATNDLGEDSTKATLVVLGRWSRLILRVQWILREGGRTLDSSCLHGNYCTSVHYTAAKTEKVWGGFQIKRVDLRSYEYVQLVIWLNISRIEYCILSQF